MATTLKRCYRCHRPAERTTKINGSALNYCPEHKPERLVAFQRMALRAMQRGQRRRHASRPAKAA